MLPSQLRSVRCLMNLNSLKRQLLLSMLPLLVVCSGCTALPNWFNATLSPAPVGLTIRQVEPAGQPGNYTIAGSASLPDQTQITIAAVRYFQSVAPAEAEAGFNPNYAILDRQTALVNQGNWEAKLNLWQVAPDGQYQEAWQLGDSVQLEPASTVSFLATLDPPNQPSDLKAKVENQDDSVQATLARFTTDGELYLQAVKTLPIALPTGSTAPPTPSAPRASRTSSNPATTAPSAEKPVSPADAWSQTNAPLSPDQLLR